MTNRRRFVLDTDIGGDCDDVMALCLLAAAHRRGEIELIGVTCSIPIAAAGSCAAAILHAQYGLDGIPVYNLSGAPDDYYPKDCDYYASRVTEKFPGYPADVIRPEDSLTGLRSLLASSEDQSVTLVATGPLRNIGRLLESPPDDLSPLDGVSLVRRKVSLLAVMGGNFAHLGTDEKPVAEFNIKVDVPMAQTVARLSPVPTVFLPYEAGLDMISGRRMLKEGEALPSAYAFLCHGSKNGRHSWDPATALYALYGENGMFRLSEEGRVTFCDSGVSDFTPMPGGREYYLTLQKPKQEIADAIDARIE